MNADVHAKIATLEWTVGSLRRTTASALPSVADHTRRAVIAAKLRVMVIIHVPSVRKPATLVAIIPSAASYVMSLVCLVLRIVHGLVHIAANAHYHAQYHAMCYHAQNAVR